MYTSIVVRSLGWVKLDGEVADGDVMVKRPSGTLFRLRNPEWRQDLAFRVGFPVLGVVAAVTFAWLVIQA